MPEARQNLDPKPVRISQAALSAYERLWDAVSETLESTDSGLSEDARSELLQAITGCTEAQAVEVDLSCGLGEDVRAQLIEEARGEYANDEINIYDDARLSDAGTHAWVQAWVMVETDGSDDTDE